MLINSFASDVMLSKLKLN